jgi:hypothetical protein
MGLGQTMARINARHRMASTAALIAIGLLIEPWRESPAQAPVTSSGKAAAAKDSTPKPPPRITPSKATTKVVAPLDEDGYVDYVAALNEIYGKGVTPENNAGLLFVRASRIEGFGPAERKRFFELLHCPELPAQGDYLTDFNEYVSKRLDRGPTQREEQDRDRAIRAPWSAQDLPLIAQWIEFNEKPLRLVVEGTRRPKCYFPFVLAKGACLFDMLLPAVQAARTAARLLTARAMLELGKGNFEQAANDLLACHRLGRLIGTTPFGIGALVGLAIDTDACVSDVALMNCGQLSADRALACQRELRGLIELPRLDEMLDRSERLSYLQALGVLARPKGLNGERSAIFKDMPPFVSETTMFDWTEVLEVGNEQFDRAVAILREPGIPRRQAAWERFHRDFTALHEEVKRHDFNQLPLKEQLSRKAMSREFGKIMITSFFPAVRAVSETKHRVEARTVLDQVGFALTAYAADHRGYPKELAALAPHYIERVPADPINEQPLHYERRPDGFVLYSVGSNGKDDGGAGYGEKPSSDDLVIRVVKR